jgi:hypothetical protein
LERIAGAVVANPAKICAAKSGGADRDKEARSSSESSAMSDTRLAKKPRPPCLEASLKCRSCRKGHWAPPVRMLKLTEARSITAYKWVHPDEER